MAKRKLVITHNVEKSLAEKIQKIIPDWEVIYGKEPEIWEKHLDDAEVLAGWKPNVKDTVLNSSKLRWIQTWSAGVNNLPLKDLKVKEILITGANGVHSYPISETIFGLILSLTRKIHTYVKNQQSKRWDHANMNAEIHGKTIGILGIGAIGLETAKIAKAFGMKVLGVRHSGQQAEFVDEMFTSDKLHTVLPQCDYVVVTLPLTEETKGMFGKNEFSLMKPSSFFINIGRGSIAVESEMIEALKNQKIAGAGLDVFEQEPLPANNPLWELENVIVTPHTAGSTEYYDKRLIEEIFIPNLKEYAEGQMPSLNLVDYKKGY
ncbi:D-2-hydroxyacid dehydrogenase [Bacillus sp. MUM 13]|uniref:D-2-hydroxyacid dehydrogenase n=1 Tax=Bacillus sp. MUM 13 TaxID=1678001 RepID=UPI0008F5F19D|nr:D-2-hydroxyacid dehydrogenase [Bacillus sp. MUM 13]OIK14870.1 hydroxyacid dehydrogenase [Bacillus sp. MUM 13]